MLNASYISYFSTTLSLGAALADKSNCIHVFDHFKHGFVPKRAGLELQVGRHRPVGPRFDTLDLKYLISSLKSCREKWEV